MVRTPAGGYADTLLIDQPNDPSRGALIDPSAPRARVVGNFGAPRDTVIRVSRKRWVDRDIAL